MKDMRRGYLNKRLIMLKKKAVEGRMVEADEMSLESKGPTIKLGRSLLTASAISAPRELLLL